MNRIEYEGTDIGAIVEVNSLARSDCGKRAVVIDIKLDYFLIETIGEEHTLFSNGHVARLIHYKCCNKVSK